MTRSSLLKKAQLTLLAGIAVLGASEAAMACGSDPNSGREFCVGDQVITSDGYRGTVRGVFQNGEKCLSSWCAIGSRVVGGFMVLDFYWFLAGCSVVIPLKNGIQSTSR